MSRRLRSIVTVKVPRAKHYIKLHAHSIFSNLNLAMTLTIEFKDIMNYYNVMITQSQRAVQENHCLCNDGVRFSSRVITLNKMRQYENP